MACPVHRNPGGLFAFFPNLGENSVMFVWIPTLTSSAGASFSSSKYFLTTSSGSVDAAEQGGKEITDQRKNEKPKRYNMSKSRRKNSNDRPGC